MALSRAAAAFPRRSAVTRRFTLGRPRGFSVAPDGSTVAFLRSMSGTDPVQRLWVLDVGRGDERCVLDPAEMAEADGALPPEERAARERTREMAGGIVRYATDSEVTRAVTSLAGRLLVVDFATGSVTDLDVAPPAVDPRLSPDGTHVAFVRDGGLCLVDATGGDVRVLADERDPAVTWGLAEFVAAEEMGRSRGFWWSPDGQRIAASRVDVAPVPRWHLADPVEPADPPVQMRYPAAGKANADVELAVIALDGTRVAVDWDRERLPYLAAVTWPAQGPLTITLQRRDQRCVEVHTVDPETGRTTLATAVEGEPWVELVAGTPRWAGAHLLTCVDDPGAGRSGTRRLALDGVPVSPPGLQVRRVAGANAHAALITASAEDPTEVGVWRVPLDGGEPDRLDSGGGVASVAGSPSAHVLERASITDPATTAEVRSAAGSGRIASSAERPELVPQVELATLDDAGLHSALVRPSWHDGVTKLPVLLDPYGGPHAQRVLRSQQNYLTAQWFAEAGFAVLVVDGRGTPGRGPAWEHAVAGDLAGVPVADQIAGLEAALTRWPFLDRDRVAIRGWSFGGFLAAATVLRRPDAVHAAVAGAPVTDWRLYDTHYTERYLGDPSTQTDAYAHSSLLDDAHRLTRPLLLIHGLADDNVVAAHTLRLSRALLEAGRAHRVLPLSGVTHMTPQESVAEHLLTLQLDFLREALALPRE